MSFLNNQGGLNNRGFQKKQVKVIFRLKTASN